MISVATSLANDGIASPVASLINDGIKGSYGVHIPFGVIVDLGLRGERPDRVNRGGIGDVISNISALADWELAREVRGEPVDGLAASLARMGAEAMLTMPGDMSDDAFVTVLAESLISSGLAMAVCGSSRPASGGCHEIMHAIDSLFPAPARTVSWPGWARCSAPSCAATSAASARCPSAWPAPAAAPPADVGLTPSSSSRPSSSRRAPRPTATRSWSTSP
jgi:hypothetical protein